MKAGRMMLVIVVVALVGIGSLTYYAYVNQPKPCCVPEPAKGQLFLQSYNFQTNGTSGSLFAVLGVFEGQGLNVSQVSLDGVSANHSNSNLTTSCGNQTENTPPSQWTSYVCMMTIDFGSSFPAPPSDSEHNLAVVMSNGEVSTFQVTAGYLFEATGTSTG